MSCPFPPETFDHLHDDRASLGTSPNHGFRELNDAFSLLSSSRPNPPSTHGGKPSRTRPTHPLITHALSPFVVLKYPPAQVRTRSRGFNPSTTSRNCSWTPQGGSPLVRLLLLHSTDYCLPLKPSAFSAPPSHSRTSSTSFVPLPFSRTFSYVPLAPRVTLIVGSFHQLHRGSPDRFTSAARTVVSR